MNVFHSDAALATTIECEDKAALNGKKSAVEVMLNEMDYISEGCEPLENNGSL